MYLMYAVKGNDLYNHSKCRAVLHENIDASDVDHYFEHRVKEYKEVLKHKDAAWFQLFILRIDVDGIETVRSWGERNQLLEKTQINSQAKGKSSKQAFADALSAMETFGTQSSIPVMPTVWLNTHITTATEST